MKKLSFNINKTEMSNQFKKNIFSLQKKNHMADELTKDALHLFYTYGA